MTIPTVKSAEKVRTILVQAEADMVVVLEEAHRDNPDMNWLELHTVPSVEKYGIEIQRDLKNQLGNDYEIRFKALPDTEGKLYFLVKIYPIVN